MFLQRLAASEMEKAQEPCRALSLLPPERKWFCLVLADGQRWKFFWGLESSLSVLEEEWLEDGVYVWKAFLWGSREERNKFVGSNELDLDSFCNGGGERAERRI